VRGVRIKTTAVRKPRLKKHLMARKKAQDSVVFPIVFILFSLC
jgi:hypothetical protein